VSRADHRPAALTAGVTLLTLLLGVALCAPWLAPQPPETQDLGRRLEGPTLGHPLGRDDLGRDVLSRLLWGARTSLPLGLFVVLVCSGSGTLLGAAAAYAGGGADLALGAAADLLLAFPGILLAIAFVGARGPGVENLFAALCLIGWVGYARLARGETRRLMGHAFVESARSAGLGGAAIVMRHIVPNLMAPILVQAALGLGGVIMAEAGLSFLGLGVPPPTPSWGGMLRDGTQNLLDAPRLTLVPGVAIFVTVLAAQLLAEGLRLGMSGMGSDSDSRA
jgi:peptide/nickel transport system permease protein